MRWAWLVLLLGCGSGGAPREVEVRVATPRATVPEPIAVVATDRAPLSAAPPSRAELDWPPGAITRPCTDASSMWQDVEGELSFVMQGDMPTITGELRFVGRTAKVTLEGQPPREGDEGATYDGSMKEVGGLGTVWPLELRVVSVGGALRGTLLEVVSSQGAPRKDVICHVDIGT